MHAFDEYPYLDVRPGRPGTGLGLFTKVPIEEGAFVVEYTGKLIPTKEAEKMEDTHRYLFQISDTWSIDGETEDNLARYVNHSCDPNCEADMVDGHLAFFAARDIEAGEELTIDYGPEYVTDYIRPVGCGCRRCTKSN